MTGVNKSTFTEWRPRWYYILRNKTTGVRYFGQTLREDMSKYLGSGVYWKPHCYKNGGYNKTNIEIVNKWWIDDRDLAYLLIDEFESMYPEYWLKTNKQWANQIPENTEDAPNFTNLSPDIRKKAIKNRVATLSQLDENGISGFDKIGEKISESKSKIQENGLPVGKNGAIKSAKTKSEIIDENGLNVHQKSGKRSKETKDMVGEDGLNTHQRSGRALAERKYTQIDESGLNAHQRIGKAVSATKNSKEWKSTKGVESIRKLKSTLSKIEDNGKTIAQNRAVIGGETQKSEEWKRKNYLQCDHCGTICNPGNHNRWHGDNCRHKREAC
jgi:hypothetical protein